MPFNRFAKQKHKKDASAPKEILQSYKTITIGPAKITRNDLEACSKFIQVLSGASRQVNKMFQKFIQNWNAYSPVTQQNIDITKKKKPPGVTSDLN